MSASRTLVMIPTYNEAENIARLIGELLALSVEGLEVLVVDDKSPDGTARIVASLAERDSRVRLLVREGPPGRGAAGRDGFLFALEHGFDRLVEMDGDFSHQPRHVPALLAALEDCDLAVGSRRVPGGSDLDRRARRKRADGANRRRREGTAESSRDHRPELAWTRLRLPSVY